MKYEILPFFLLDIMANAFGLMSLSYNRQVVDIKLLQMLSVSHVAQMSQRA